MQPDKKRPFAAPWWGTDGGPPVQPTLAQSLAAGDPAAFAALYDRLASRLFSTARIMTGSTTDAEDVVHDLFVDLARGRSRLAGIADLEAYVFTMLRNAVSRRRRRAAVARQENDIGQWSLLAAAAAAALLVMAWGGHHGLASSDAGAAVTRQKSLADRTTLTSLRLELIRESML